MERKATWIIYLIIGVFSVLGFSCEKETGEPIQKVTYVYLNKLPEIIRFELYNTEDKLSIENVLEPDDSITFVISGTPGAFPFFGNEASNRTGDSVIFRYENGTCTTFVRDKSTGTFSGTGVFDVAKYENYSVKLASQKSYTLRYLINEKDYSIAEPCE